jgi:hypothetical protein
MAVTLFKRFDGDAAFRALVVNAAELAVKEGPRLGCCLVELVVKLVRTSDAVRHALARRDAVVAHVEPARLWKTPRRLTQPQP